jgi:hypothetical protein
MHDSDGRPKALTPTGRQALARFTAAVQKEAEALKGISLNVLIWGQAPDRDTAPARKRRDIAAALEEAGHNAIMPERLAIPGCPDALVAVELAEAKHADCIVALLEGSPGALCEVHDFGCVAGVGEKLIVFAPACYREGYSGLGLLRDLHEARGAVYWYEPEDLDVCRVLTIALNRVAALRRLELSHGIVTRMRDNAG